MFDSSDGDDARKCPRCGVLRSIEQFAWRLKSEGKRQPYCRACQAEYNRAHYLANRELYIRRARTRAIRVHRERVTFLVDYLSAHACVDCGERDPLVLEFDHLEDKTFNISDGLRDRGWQALLDEIAKCEVVCANCHRRRTAHRGGFRRAAAVANAS